MERQLQVRRHVLIPSSSGQAFNPEQLRSLILAYVLIPSSSGQVFNANPRADPIIAPQVLIPSSSGQAFNKGACSTLVKINGS